KESEFMALSIGLPRQNSPCFSKRSIQKQKPLSLWKTASVQYGSPGRTRTSDQLVNSQPLYRLSYRGIVPDIIPYSHDSSRVKCQRTPSIPRYFMPLQHDTRRLRKLQKGARVCRT